MIARPQINCQKNQLPTPKVSGGDLWGFVVGPYRERSERPLPANEVSRPLPRREAPRPLPRERSQRGPYVLGRSRRATITPIVPTSAPAITSTT
jgi:hypothetical protein